MTRPRSRWSRSAAGGTPQARPPTRKVDGRPVVVRGHGIGAVRDGLWATAAVVPRAALIDVPEGAELPAAAAMGVAGVTAWRAVTELTRVKADDTVLVLGASGGVGGIIVSAVHALGATAIGQTGHDDNAGWTKQRGADHVVAADAAHLGGATGGPRRSSTGSVAVLPARVSNCWNRMAVWSSSVPQLLRRVRCRCNCSMARA